MAAAETVHGSLCNVDPTPIANIGPDLDNTDLHVINGTITITWPFSVLTRSIAFNLAEHDVRRRRDRGLIRIQFRGPAAQAIQDAGIAAGDGMRISLRGASWQPAQTPPVRQAGTSHEWQLEFSNYLCLDFRASESEDAGFNTITVNEPAEAESIPNSLLANVSIPITPSVGLAHFEPIEPIPRLSFPSKRVADLDVEGVELSSPAFVKRARMSYGSLFEGGLDIFENDVNKSKQQTKQNNLKSKSRFSMGQTSWRYSSKSPSPEREDAEHSSGEDVSDQVDDALDTGTDTKYGTSTTTAAQVHSLLQDGDHAGDLGHVPLEQEPISSAPYFSTQVSSAQTQYSTLSHASQSGLEPMSPIPENDATQPPGIHQEQRPALEITIAEESPVQPEDRSFISQLGEDPSQANADRPISSHSKAAQDVFSASFEPVEQIQTADPSPTNQATLYMDHEASRTRVSSQPTLLQPDVPIESFQVGASEQALEYDASAAKVASPIATEWNAQSPPSAYDPRTMPGETARNTAAGEADNSPKGRSPGTQDLLVHEVPSEASIAEDAWNSLTRMDHGEEVNHSIGELSSNDYAPISPERPSFNAVSSLLNHGLETQSSSIDIPSSPAQDNLNTSITAESPREDDSPGSEDGSAIQHVANSLDEPIDLSDDEIQSQGNYLGSDSGSEGSGLEASESEVAEDSDDELNDSPEGGYDEDGGDPGGEEDEEDEEDEESEEDATTNIVPQTQIASPAREPILISLLSDSEDEVIDDSRRKSTSHSLPSGKESRRSTKSPICSPTDDQHGEQSSIYKATLSSHAKSPGSQEATQHDIDEENEDLELVEEAERSVGAESDHSSLEASAEAVDANQDGHFSELGPADIQSVTQDPQLAQLQNPEEQTDLPTLTNNNVAIEDDLEDSSKNQVGELSDAVFMSDGKYHQSIDDTASQSIQLEEELVTVAQQEITMETLVPSTPQLESEVEDRDQINDDNSRSVVEAEVLSYSGGDAMDVDLQDAAEPTQQAEEEVVVELRLSPQRETVEAAENGASGDSNLDDGVDEEGTSADDIDLRTSTETHQANKGDDHQPLTEQAEAQHLETQQPAARSSESRSLNAAQEADALVDISFGVTEAQEQPEDQYDKTDQLEVARETLELVVEIPGIPAKPVEDYIETAEGGLDVMEVSPYDEQQMQQEISPVQADSAAKTPQLVVELPSVGTLSAMEIDEVSRNQSIASLDDSRPLSPVAALESEEIEDSQPTESVPQSKAMQSMDVDQIRTDQLPKDLTDRHALDEDNDYTDANHQVLAEWEDSQLMLTEEPVTEGKNLGSDPEEGVHVDDQMVPATLHDDKVAEPLHEEPELIITVNSLRSRAHRKSQSRDGPSLGDTSIQLARQSSPNATQHTQNKSEIADDRSVEVRARRRQKGSRDPSISLARRTPESSPPQEPDLTTVQHSPQAFVRVTRSMGDVPDVLDPSSRLVGSSPSQSSQPRSISSVAGSPQRPVRKTRTKLPDKLVKGASTRRRGASQSEQGLKHHDPAPRQARETRSSVRNTAEPETADAMEKHPASSPIIDPVTDDGEATEESEQVRELSSSLNGKLRDNLPDALALKDLRRALSKTTDILAVVTQTPPKAHREKSGPRDFMLDITITDPSIVPPTVSTAIIYRPDRNCLPIVHEGDVVVLRQFNVQSVKDRGFGVRAGDDSAWAVFEKDDEEQLAQIKGPPVEVSESEREFADGLRTWWDALDDKMRRRIANATERSLRVVTKGKGHERGASH